MGIKIKSVELIESTHTSTVSLQHLHIWQDVSGCCIQAGRARVGVWTIKAFGNCPIENKWVEYYGRGPDLYDAVDDLLDKMSEVLLDERILRHF